MAMAGTRTANASRHPGAAVAAAAAPAVGSLEEAAAAAEFASKTYVWVPDSLAGYLPATVDCPAPNAPDSHSVVRFAADATTRIVPTDDLASMNPPKFDKVDDIAHLTFLNEASVVHNVRQRYLSGLIYTFSGLFLVAVNPYHPLPIYTDAHVAAYKGKRREDNPPHIFAVADGAMRNMLDQRENQSLLITGESGAGKTENTKKVIQYLAAIAADSAPDADRTLNQPNNSRNSSSSRGDLSRIRTTSSRFVEDHLQGIDGLASKRLGLLERQILQANPILESFGNAQTIRNNNSSRFGKFVRIEFTSIGAIAGANIDWYLLEKSRVTNRSPRERSFHIFYQLLRSDALELKEKLLLTPSPDDYAYLKDTRKDIEGVDDASEFRSLMNALNVVGFSPDERTNLFRVVAAILHVGNMQVASVGDQARIQNPDQVEKVCHVLGVPQADFTNALTRPRAKAGREWVTNSRSKKQVQDEMAALCKTLYEKTFASIVERVNKALDRPTSKSSFIGVLDIAGFEIFEHNSFEQLCINYTNEKLQQFFNHHMFILEQEEYAREGIEWDFVNFGLDLQPTILLIESTAPVGILSTLDEECIMPKATDLTFTEKLNGVWGPQGEASRLSAVSNGVVSPADAAAKYAPARFGQGFTVKHYAGAVEYRTEEWLDKNKDPLNDNLTRVLAQSTDRYIALLFAEYATDADAVSTGKRKKRGAFRTVAQRHKEQLASLMAQLASTQPHFVRCIVPNTEKKPGKMDVPLVLEQLRCNGVLEGIRIARLGYPNRLFFSEFRARYEVLTQGIIPKGYMDGRKAVQRMVDALQLHRSVFKIGTSKIFFKAGVLAELEERRDGLLYDLFSRFGAACRMFTARRAMKKVLNRAAAIRLIQRNAREYVELRQWPWWQLYTKVRPLLAATRQDEELRRKELELQMASERAQRDEQEHTRLAQLKHELESQMAAAEAELAQERALSTDKDQLLARSQDHEAQLREEVTALQADMDALESHLEAAQLGRLDAEQALRGLQEQHQVLTQQMAQLKAEQAHWSARGQQHSKDMETHQAEVEKLRASHSALSKEKATLARKATEKEEDLQRFTKRMNVQVQDLEHRLAEAANARKLAQSQIVERDEVHQAMIRELDTLKQTHVQLGSNHQALQLELSTKQKEVANAQKERDAYKGTATEHKTRLDSTLAELKVAKTRQAEMAQAAEQLQAELDRTTHLLTTKTSEGDERLRELQASQVEELASLRTQLAQAQDAHAQSQAELSKKATQLKADVAHWQDQFKSKQKEHEDATALVQVHMSRLAKAAEALTVLESAKAATEADLAHFKVQHESVSRDLSATRKQLEELKVALASAEARHRVMEDNQVVPLQRKLQEYTDRHASLSAELDSERSLRKSMSTKATKLQKQVAELEQDSQEKDAALAELNTVLSDTQVELRRAQSMTNKTIVEHVHVLEEAKKYTDRQLADTSSQLQELLTYTRTLEKTKARLIGENEDLTHQVTQLNRTRTNSSPSQPSAEAAQLSQAARDARRQRDEALSSARRKELHAEEVLSRIKHEYESRIATLEKELRGSQSARGNTFVNVEELIRSTPDDPELGTKILDELRASQEQLESEMSTQAEAVQSPKPISPPLSTPTPTPALQQTPREFSSSSSGKMGRPGASGDVKRKTLMFGGSTRANSHSAQAQVLAESRKANTASPADSMSSAARSLSRRESKDDLTQVSRSRDALEAQLYEVCAQLEAEQIAHHQSKLESASLRTTLQELQIDSSSGSHALAEARDAAKTYKAKMDSYAQQIQALESQSPSSSQPATGDVPSQARLQQMEQELVQAKARANLAHTEADSLRAQIRQLKANPPPTDGSDADQKRMQTQLEESERLLHTSQTQFDQKLASVTAELDAHQQVLSQLQTEHARLKDMNEQLQRQLATQQPTVAS